jgi:hypothetical protein
MAVFSGSESGFTLHVDTSREYDAGITPEIDKQIRHMTAVEMYCHGRAEMLRQSVPSSNFRVIAQTDPQTQRPRFYVAPSNNQGIHEELADAVLLKAALGMTGR